MPSPSTSLSRKSPTVEAFFIPFRWITGPSRLRAGCPLRSGRDDKSVWVSKGNCRSLHYGRDDKGKMGCLPKCWLSENQPQISPLRAARSGRDDKICLGFEEELRISSDFALSKISHSRSDFHSFRWTTGPSRLLCRPSGTPPSFMTDPALPCRAPTMPSPSGLVAVCMPCNVCLRRRASLLSVIPQRSVA